jgi:hypothetical protein
LPNVWLATSPPKTSGVLHVASSIATSRPSTASSALLGAARVLLGLAGLFGGAAASYFTFFAPVGHGAVSTAYDWFVAIWKILLSIAMVAVAVAPGLTPGRRTQLAIWLVLTDVVFGLVKLFGYHETSSFAFFIVDAVVLVLLGIAKRSR